MDNTQTNWEEMGISNDFLFGKIMRNPEICKELLQIILPDVKIGHVEYPESQKSIHMDVDARSVRLDIYVHDDGGIVYNVEMQVLTNKNLPQRSRYYQGMIDLQLLDKGQHYTKLNQSYVIFICPFDLYGKGRHVYTFENICTEDRSIRLGDKTKKIFLNAMGMMDDASGDLKAFLDYVAGKESNNDFVKRLDESVREARKNREWRHEYMTLLMRDQENIERGMEKGMEKGIRGMISALHELEIDESVIFQKIREKFHLSEDEAKSYLEGGN